MSIFNYFACGGALLLLFVLFRARDFGKRSAYMPPGPPTVPILGNALLLPRIRLHRQFTKWAKMYGDVFSLVVLGKPIIVLNSPSAIKEVLEKCSLSSSSRPKSILADMITPNSLNFGTAHLVHGTWKAMRKASSQLLSNERMKALVKFQQAESAQLMWDISHSPEKWFWHLKRATTSFATGMIYGLRSPTLSSQFVAGFLYVQPRFLKALELGNLPPVDLFPFLAWVPERWAKWKATVNEVRVMHESLYDLLLSTVEERVASGEGKSALMEDMITNFEQYGLKSRKELAHLAGTLLEGSDTCSAVMHNVVYLLVKYPRVARRAQEEIDAVVGRDRMPTLNDMPKLPYVLAIIEEVFRLRPIAPVGIPHCMVQDEYINGMLFPKDSVIFFNLWGIMHDERYFDQPDEFMPERFLKHPLGVKDGVEDDPARRNTIRFGAGRRVCPGIAAVRPLLEINVANLIWAFEFSPARDTETGLEILPNLDDHDTGLLANPRPYPIKITLRLVQHKELINKQFSAASDILSGFEYDLSEADRVFNEIYRDSPSA